LCATAFFLADATAFVLAGVATGTSTATVAATAEAGAGIAGSLFVLTCATAVVASIVPKTNQQFVFINL
jgi:hypothetical protein